MFGEEGGWQFMDALHENIHHYTHSGSKPCKQAARGEVPIGVSFAFRGAKSKAKGAPIDIIIPSEGIGWDMEATAIVEGTKNLEAAKTLVDWSITEKANMLYNEGYAVIAIQALAKPVEHFPEGIVEAMIDNDFEFAANNRRRILAEWQKRYDSSPRPSRSVPIRTASNAGRRRPAWHAAGGVPPLRSFFSPCPAYHERRRPPASTPPDAMSPDASTSQGPARSPICGSSA